MLGHQEPVCLVLDYVVYVYGKSNLKCEGFLMASCGGAIGMGTVLRYPSTVYNNVGLQFFVPYLIAMLLLAIPALSLELAAGNAYRGGCVVAYNNMSHRLKVIRSEPGDLRETLTQYD